jgi:transposase InsO family protein
VQRADHVPPAAKARRDDATPTSATAPALPAPRADGDRAEPGLDLGHHPAAGTHRGIYYRVYVILDLFSRFVVGWMLAPSLSKVVASAEQASSSRPWGENKN